MSRAESVPPIRDASGEIAEQKSTSRVISRGCSQVARVCTRATMEASILRFVLIQETTETLEVLFLLYLQYCTNLNLGVWCVGRYQIQIVSS